MEDNENKLPEGWEQFADYRLIGYDISDRGVLLHYTGTDEVVEIPMGITEIDDYAFKGCAIRSVLIPSSVKRVGTFAFYRCERLEEVTIGSGVERICPYAFLECSSLKRICYHGSIGAWRRINDWKGTIGKYTLDCTGSSTGVFAEEQQEVALPRLEISDDGDVVMPESENLKEREPFLKRLRRATPWILFGAALLCLLAAAALMIYFSNEALYFFLFKPYLLILPVGFALSFAIAGFLLLRRGDHDWYKSGRGISMLVVMIVISLSFLGSLSFLFIPKPKNIDECTLEYYYQVKEDGTAAICGCTARSVESEIVFPSEIDGYTVTEITRVNAFWGPFRKSLRSVVIPSSVTAIRYNAFSACDSLQSIYYEGDVAGWCEISLGVNNDWNDYSHGILYGRTLYIDGKKVEGELVIPSNATKIGSGVFAGYTHLTSIKISSNVTTIGANAFSECTGLNSVTFAEDSNLKIIETKAFSGCSRLISIKIPSSVTNMGCAVFSGCSGLVEIEIPFVGAEAGNTNQYPFGYIFGSSYYAGSTEITQEVIISNTSRQYIRYHIPSSLRRVTVMGGGEMIYGAFQNCYMLTSVILPDGLTKIGEYAFFACYDLTTITIPSSVTNIKPLAFNGCHRLVEIYNQSSLLMEKGSNENGYIAYYAKNIYDVKGSSKLSTTDDGYVLYKEGDLVSVIAYFGPDTSLTLSSEITEINELAFYKCIGLTSITIPSSIKTINTQAFQECTALTSIIYQGTTAQWREMSRYSDWDLWTGNYVVHCTDGDISKE